MEEAGSWVVDCNFQIFGRNIWANSCMESEWIMPSHLTITSVWAPFNVAINLTPPVELLNNQQKLHWYRAELWVQCEKIWIGSEWRRPWIFVNVCPPCKSGICPDRDPAKALEWNPVNSPSRNVNLDVCNSFCFIGIKGLTWGEASCWNLVGCELLQEDESEWQLEREGLHSHGCNKSPPTRF